MSQRAVVVGLWLGIAVSGCGDDSVVGEDSSIPVVDSGLVCDPPCGDANCCSGMCVDLDTNADFCGSCATNCPSAQVCRGGFCVFPQDGAMDSGVPFDGPVSDAGSCVAECDAGSATDAGRDDDAGFDGDGGIDAAMESDAGPPVCDPSCPASQRCCAAGCVNRVGLDASDESFDNCGACGFACDSTKADRCDRLTSGTNPLCLCGTNLACAGDRVCVSSLCVDLQTDPDNCGSVGFSCAAGESCVGGACRCGDGTACGLLEACCADACVVVDTDPSNCGSCGNVCPQWATNCNGGTCGCGGGPACDPPVQRVFDPGEPGESCCGGVCVPNTDASCACTACTGDDTCQVPSLTATSEPQACCGSASVALLGCP